MSSKIFNRRWLRFSLRTLLAVVLLFSIPLAWFAFRLHKARRQHEAVAGILRAGGACFYDYQCGKHGGPIEDATPPVAPRLRHALGDDFFCQVITVDLAHARDPDGAVEHLHRFPAIEYLYCCYLTGTPITDAGLERLPEMTSLKILNLNNTSITDAGMPVLHRTPNLRELWLATTQISDLSLPHVSHLTQLEVLSLNGTHITDRGLTHLTPLTNLKTLDLGRTQITDASLACLASFNKLEVLGIQSTDISDEGARTLVQPLDPCEILR